MPPRDGHPMRGDVAAMIAVTDRERVLQHPLDARRKVVVAMIAHRRAASAQQMGEARLMNRA